MRNELGIFVNDLLDGFNLSVALPGPALRPVPSLDRLLREAVNLVALVKMLVNRHFSAPRNGTEKRTSLESI